MEQLSIFDIFKIGVGPSSSHTLGPWKAALNYREELKSLPFDSIEVFLYGSLSKTGKGHKTDSAIILGLSGVIPEQTNADEIKSVMESVHASQSLSMSTSTVPFSEKTHIHFLNKNHPEHPNVITFKAKLGKRIVLEQTYCSLGGGFIKQLGVELELKNQIELPFPFENGKELLKHIETSKLELHELIFENEKSFRSVEEINNKVLEIFNTMKRCVYLGCIAEGMLPGGLKVKRRARGLCSKLLKEHQYKTMDAWEKALRNTPLLFDTLNSWISCFALAVNEENANMGRIVTSPTNGAAGVIPSVLLYHHFFIKNKGINDVTKFLFTAGAVGCLFKKGATISAAEGGCQAEIGVSSAMAAAGLTACLGGNAKQTLMAAEIAMEHHLGLTCDPIKGLVQVPCIERNSMGAIKAIMASNLALNGDPDDAIVTFDNVVKTMWETGLAMHSKYKETAEGGLAINVPVSFPNC